MLREVKRRKVWWGQQGTMNRIGHEKGVPEHIIQRCLAGMACWVNLAIHVIRHGYPDFELVTSFRALSLHRSDSTSSSRLSVDFERSRMGALARLANVLRPAFDKLRDEHDAGGTLRIYDLEGASSSQAGQKPVRQWLQSAKARAGSPSSRR